MVNINNFFINGIKLHNVTHIQDLGVIPNRQLSYSIHIKETIHKAEILLACIMRSCEFSEIQLLAILLNSFARLLKIICCLCRQDTIV